MKYTYITATVSVNTCCDANFTRVYIHAVMYTQCNMIQSAFLEHGQMGGWLFDHQTCVNFLASVWVSGESHK